MIISKLNVLFGKAARHDFRLTLHYDTIALKTKQGVREDLLQYGFELVDLIVEAITPPPEVQERVDQASGIAAQDTDKYKDIGTIDALKDAAKNPGGNAGKGLERAWASAWV